MFESNVGKVVKLFISVCKKLAFYWIPACVDVDGRLKNESEWQTCVSLSGCPRVHDGNDDLVQNVRLDAFSHGPAQLIFATMTFDRTN